MITTFIESFSSLGLFLFGMIYLEEQIKLSAGRSFKRVVEKATATQFKSLLTGLGATIIFQSSALVTLMALSLIGTQMLQFSSAIAVMFGANIGTTITSWIVALVGFKMNIKLISYLFIGIGGLGSVLASSEGRWKNYFSMLVGFGLIFLGLEGMKDSFGVISKSFDIASYIFTNPYLYVLSGFAITALIQSSSASVAIAQSALFTQMISFEAAAAFVVGANVGSTVTAMLAAIGGIPDKKRTAIAHLIFNISTALLTLLALQWLVSGIEHFFPHTDAVVQIAIFHTIFNVVGVLIWYPFIPIFAKSLKYLFKQEPIYVTKYIHNVPTDVPDLAVEALQKEITHLSDTIQEYALLVINMPPPKAYEKGVSIHKLLEQHNDNFDLNYAKLYTNIQELEGEIYRYISLLAAKNSNKSTEEILNKMLYQTTSLATAAKSIKDMIGDLNIFYDARSNEEKSFYQNLRYQILKSVLAYHLARNDANGLMDEMEAVYKQIADSYTNSMQLIESIVKNQHINSTITTRAINDMHLVKSFSKSLRNTLTQIE